MVKKKLTSHKRPLIQTPKFSQSNNLSYQPEKTADIWLRYHWFPRQQTTSEKRVQKFHTDDVSLPDLGSASDWLNQISHVVQPINLIWGWA